MVMASTGFDSKSKGCSGAERISTWLEEDIVLVDRGTRAELE